jgi:hypothetical protein
MLAVMCCSCSGVLARDGTLVKTGGGGLLEIGANLQGNDSVAQFADKEAADAFAAALGWSVKDFGGPNHKCPTCRARAPQPESTRRGAYIPL